MSLSTVNPWLPKKLAANSALYVMPQTDVYYPENNSEEADLSSAPKSSWKNIAHVKSCTYTQSTEDDAEDNYDAVTHVRIKRPNTKVTGWTYELQVERYMPVFEAMYRGVKNPLSEETLSKLSAGEKLPIHCSNNPYIPVAVKLELWDGDQNKMVTLYFYADMRADGNLSMDGKILRPTVRLEVTSSPMAMAETTTDFTGQTGVVDEP